MAIRRGIIGKLSGRLEDLVFGSWKGIQTVRTFTPPSNPRTVAQVSTRSVFGKLGHLAAQFHALGITDIFPPARRMTKLNQVVKANGSMISSKIFNLQDLQICTPNFQQFEDLTVANEPLHPSGTIQIDANLVLRVRNPFQDVKMWSVSIDNETLEVINASEHDLGDVHAGVGTAHFETNPSSSNTSFVTLPPVHHTNMTILMMIYGTLKNGRKCVLPTRSISI